MAPGSHLQGYLNEGIQAPHANLGIASPSLEMIKTLKFSSTYG